MGLDKTLKTDSSLHVNCFKTSHGRQRKQNKEIQVIDD